MVVHVLSPARAFSTGILTLALSCGLALPCGAQTPTGPPVTAKPAQPPTTVPAKPAGTTTPATVTLTALAGTWDGGASTSNGDMPIQMVLTAQDGKLSGAIESQMGTIPITGASLAGDVLTLGIDLQGSPGTITGKVAGDKFEGSWSIGAESGAFGVARARGAGAAAPASADPLSGDWDGTVEVGGQTMPFTLTLKLSGDTVTGEISSEAGKVPLTAGAWKDGTLLIAFPYSAGEPVSMVGAIQDGKLGGALDYNKGELQGTWTATKKK